MDIKIFFFSTFLYTFLASSSSITINCVYHDNGDWWVLKEFYYCNAEDHLNIDSPDRSTIDSVNGTHLEGKTLDDVEGFEADNLTIHYFPRGLEKIFKNLKMIDINHGRLKEIHQSDLKPFPKLTCLELYENDIEVLEEGLFDYNPNLEMIWLSTNKIIHIDVNVFDNLHKLTYLSLDENKCISEYTSDNATAVSQIIKISKNNCRDMIYLRKVYPIFMKKIDKIESDLRKLEFEMENHDHSSSRHVFLDTIVLVICGFLIGILGYFAYNKFLIKNVHSGARVAFENHEYS